MWDLDHWVNGNVMCQDKEGWGSGLLAVGGRKVLFWTFKCRYMWDVHVAMPIQVWSSGNDQPGEINLWAKCTQIVWKVMGLDAVQAGGRKRELGRFESLGCSSTKGGEFTLQSQHLNTNKTNSHLCYCLSYSIIKQLHLKKSTTQKLINRHCIDMQRIILKIFILQEYKRF